MRSLALSLLLIITTSAARADERSGKDHWAFQSLKKVAIPRLPKDWGRNPVDAFIAATQKAKGTTPNVEADRRTLLRRLFLDLTGLPPAPEDIESFRVDTSPHAYEKWVEKLLASPAYGERWGRHWLDVARWAESEGYESNHPRPFAWRYRDWLVRAFNSDKPFADFVREQIAGDEITPYADDHLIATGFLAACRLSSNEEDRWRQRNDLYVDIVNATASTFLGLTMQCAQCHVHRTDPITAKDYYRFQGFFLKGQPGNLALKDQSLWREYEAKKPAGYDDALQARDALFERARQRKLADVRKGLAPQALQALELAMDRRSMDQEKLARETDLLFQFTANQVENALLPEERKHYDELKKKVGDMEKTMLPPPQTFGFYSPVTSPHAVNVFPMKGFYSLQYEPQALAQAKPFLLAAGEVHRPSGVVDVGWPAFLGDVPKGALDQKPRSALAAWLTDPGHPLTARVYVNRIWQQHFGRGIVATAGDFGVKGAAPTHPELLDWLAGELHRSGGSTKHIQRLIVLSSTYRQSAQVLAENQKRDADNLTWWRWLPRRLEAEAIRDSMLAVTGELDRTLGGPSETDEHKPRRGLYLVQKREAPPGQQALFDGPFGMMESCNRRLTTTVPLQSLYLLNSTFSVKRGEALARRVAPVHERDRQVEAVFKLALGRAPDERERELARRFFAADQEAGALARFCQALMNLNEFVYLP